MLERANSRVFFADREPFIARCLQILDKRYRETKEGKKYRIAGTTRYKKFSERELTEETGINWPALKDGRRRSVPSREVVMALADYLECSLTERNDLLAVASYSPVEPLLKGDDLEAALKPARIILYKYLPYPAYIVNRNWDILEINPATLTLLGIEPQQLREMPPHVLNMLWLVFDPALMVRPQIESISNAYWVEVARRELVGFKLENRLSINEDWYREMMERFKVLPNFEEINNSADPADYADKEHLEFVTRLQRPDGAIIKVKSLFMRTGNWSYPQIIVNVPGDKATEDLFNRLGFQLPPWYDKYIIT
ncbi:MAG TPA: hypothetical protein VH186_18755 [Chloroflexia bacterium]|nr:hypothetical protein [Chloroflexia bacterium]